MTRPNYPDELFEFITSKNPNHDLVWDVGTGSGQAVLLREELVDEFKRALGGSGSIQKEVRYPIYLMMGRVGDGVPH
ncbi:hypothetical protein MKX01_021228 [Papaver californicum]|nr:hypothetical protein MKX01_021228 [Papaver californicum]